MHAFNACFAVMPVKSGVTGRATETDGRPSHLQETAAEADPEPEELAPGVDAPPGVETADEPAPTEAAPELEAAVAEAAPELTAIPEISPEQQLAEQQAAAAAVLAAAAAPVASAIDPYPQAVSQQAAVPNLQGLTQVIHISAGMVGKLIGKAGETIKGLQYSTNARIQARRPAPPRVPTYRMPCRVSMSPIRRVCIDCAQMLQELQLAYHCFPLLRDNGHLLQIDHSTPGDHKAVTVTGPTPESVASAVAQINELMRVDASPGMGEVTEAVPCPPGIVGRIIGRGGETIRGLQQASQAHIVVNQVRVEQRASSLHCLRAQRRSHGRCAAILAPHTSAVFPRSRCVAQPC